jgi:quercetin dioxygenase-like cupin family protein
MTREDVNMSAASQLPPSEVLALGSLITPTPEGIASRILGKAGGGNITLFAFDEGQGMTEHSSPFDAFVLVLDGAMTLTIGGTSVRATPGTIVRMPPNVPHALDASEPCRMLLILLK